MVRSLALQDFRNYERAEIELKAGLNLVVGRNAQGKTNLLEAVHCLGGLGSPRSVDSALIREGAESAYVHADLTRAGREIHVDLEFKSGRGMRALINKSPVPASRALGDLAVSVFFGPDELSLVKGSPDGRRRFLDDLVVKMRPAHLALRREWERVLRQRNALLRSLVPRGFDGGGDEETLVVWDEALCRIGASVAAARLRALAHMRPFVAGRYREVAGGGDLTLSYASSWLPEEAAEAALGGPETIEEAGLAEALAARLREVKPRELERRMTLVGPQRDDVVVKLASQESGGWLEARSYASQGDQRTAALALKLAEHDLLRETLREDPVLLLDDVFSELDPQRREWLKKAVEGAEQTLLSSADTGTAEALRASNAIFVESGTARVR